MVTRVVVQGNSIPPEDQLKKIANQRWENDDWLPSLDDFRNFLMSEELNVGLQEYALTET